MTEPSPPPQPASGDPQRDYQDSNYHDEEPEIQNDDLPRRSSSAIPPRRKPPRMPPPKRRFEED